MDWYSIGVSALIGGVAGGVGFGLAGRFTRNKTVKIIVAVALFTLLNAVMKTYLEPQVDGIRIEAEIEELAEAGSVFADIKTHEPDLFQDLVDRAGQSRRDGQSMAQVTRQLQADIRSAVLPRLPYASDEAILEVTRVNIMEMEDLRAAGGEYCRSFLFPDHPESILFSTKISKEAIDRETLALREIFATADMEMTLPDPREAEELMAPLFEDIIVAFGGAVFEAFADPYGEHVDTDALCAVGIDIYASVLTLAPDDAVSVLRNMYAAD
jgi:hypothetical protein